MKIVNVLEHEGRFFTIDEKVKVALEDGKKIRGKIKWFGDGVVFDALMEKNVVTEMVEIGKNIVLLSDIQSIEKVPSRTRYLEEKAENPDVEEKEM